MRSAKIAKHKILLIPLSMLAVTLIAGYFLSHMPLGVSATTGDVSLRVKDTCSMNGNVVTDDSNMLNGQEREGFHVLSLTTYCNDNAGFSIYAVGYSGDLEGSTDLTGATTGLTISTADWADRNTGDNATKSIYSLKIEKDNTSYLPGNISILNGFTDYLAVPSTNTKVASYSSNTDTTTESTINANYAVKVANLQAADTYTGKVKYTMVHPSSNTATGFTFDDAFQLAGKSRVSGTSYFAMQDMNAAICNKVTTPLTADAASTPQAQLIDIRDNKVYWVAKLMDGKCWMTQNLDFDINDTTKQYLTSEYTDLVASGASPYATTDGYSMDANGKITWTPVRNTIVSTTTGASFSWPNDPDTPYTIDLGDWYYRSDYYNNDDCGDQNCNYHTGNAGDQFSQTTGANGTHSHVGNYYNWSAAVASNNTNGYTSGTPSNSICPKGWKLPANGGVNDNGTYSNLNKLYNGDITTASELGSTAAADKLLLASPLYFVRAGNVWSNALYYAGHAGLYWSSTVINASGAYFLGFRSSGVFPSSSGNRRDGNSVRCVVDDSMQSFGQDAASSLAINESLQLRDVRDGNIYTVGKLRDGQVWLLDNLRLGSDTEITLTPADTNTATNFTLPASSTDKFSDNTAGWTTPGINTSLSNTISTNGVYQGNIGVFYNYCAASAGTICAPKGENASNASYDICPASWRMPTGGSSGEYQALYAAYNSDYTNFQTALRTPLSGYFGVGSADYQGSYGGFWSSTRYDGYYMHSLYANASNVYPQDYYWRNLGISVRCVLK